MRDSERGFILLEIMVLVLVIVACIGSVRMLDRAAELSVADGVRSQAVFLAREELARLEYLGARGALSPGSYDWLGDAADISVDDITFTPRANVTYEEMDVASVQVTVVWSGSTTQGMVELEGRIRNGDAVQTGGS